MKNKELEKILRDKDSKSAKMNKIVNKKEIDNKKEIPKTNIPKKEITTEVIAMIEIKEKEVQAETEVETKIEVEAKIEDMAVEVSRVTAIIHNHNRMVDITEVIAEVTAEVTEDIVTTKIVITTETTTNRIITTVWFKHPNLSKKENPFLSLLLNQ